MPLLRRNRFFPGRKLSPSAINRGKSDVVTRSRSFGSFSGYPVLPKNDMSLVRTKPELVGGLGSNRSYQFHSPALFDQPPIPIFHIETFEQSPRVPTSAIQSLFMEKGVRVRVTDPHVGHIDLLLSEKLALRNVFRSLSKPKERGLKPKAFGIGKRCPVRYHHSILKSGWLPWSRGNVSLCPTRGDIPFSSARAATDKNRKTPNRVR